MEYIKFEGLSPIVNSSEREYLRPNSIEGAKFEAFMLSLGFNCTGVYVSDIGKTQIFY